MKVLEAYLTTNTSDPLGLRQRASDEEIAIDLAQVVAIAAAQKFVSLTHRPLMEREIHSSKFMSERLPLMNERECDYEDNGEASAAANNSLALEESEPRIWSQDCP